jgi:uncharacterized protein involved in response to NO
MPDKPIDITVSQHPRTEVPSDDEPGFPRYGGPPFLSYGFRPFFLGAALFAGVAIPVWVAVVAGLSDSGFLYHPREWHVHEMLFGFLPAVMTGFLLTAMPNWTGRAPLRGVPLLSLWVLWLAGRLLIAMPWPDRLVAAVVDGTFLLVLAVLVWREIVAGGSWTQTPIAGVIALYAAANISFHASALRGAPTDFSERSAVALVMLLLTMIGGRVTPNFTREFLVQNGMAERVAPFSRLDGLSMVLALASAVTWILQPEGVAAAGMWLVTGLVNVIRLSRWRGWMAWREPLVWILHVGYGWLVLSFLALGTALLGIGLPMPNAVHVLTTGAVGTMTLAVMTRASLGHTGRRRHADSMTVLIYALANLGGILRVLTPTPDAPTPLTNLLLSLAALSWSGAYVLYATVYGRYLLRPSLDE